MPQPQLTYHKNKNIYNKLEFVVQILLLFFLSCGVVSQFLFNSNNTLSEKVESNETESNEEKAESKDKSEIDYYVDLANIGSSMSSNNTKVKLDHLLWWKNQNKDTITPPPELI